MTKFQRHRVIRSLTGLLLLAIPVRGQAPALPDRGGSGPIRAGQNTMAGSAGVDIQDAGLPRGATPQSLTLRNAYALALSRQHAQLARGTTGAA